MGLIDTCTAEQLHSLRAIVDSAPRTGPLGAATVDDLRTLVPADQVLMLELDAEREHVRALAATGFALPSGAAFRQAFWSALWECEACAYPDLGGDRESVRTLSDFYTPEQMARTRMARLFGASFGTAHAAWLALPSAYGAEARLAFVRRDRDFDDDERLTLALLRPHLAAAYRRFSERRSGLSNLTPRQRTILHLVAIGCSNAEIARRLFVSPGTVRKHLDLAFRQLGVSSRASAVSRAFPDGVPPFPTSETRDRTASPASMSAAVSLPRQRPGPEAESAPDPHSPNAA